MEQSFSVCCQGNGSLQLFYLFIVTNPYHDPYIQNGEGPLMTRERFPTPILFIFYATPLNSLISQLENQNHF